MRDHRTLVVRDPRFREHAPARAHPERPERLDAVDRTLLDALQNDCKQSLAELGAQVGLSAREVDSVLARLIRLGMIHPDGSGFVITDVARMQEFLEFLEMPEPPGDY